MDKIYAEHGLEVLQYICLPIQNDIAKPWGHVQLMGATEFVEAAVIPTCLKNPTLSPTADEWRVSLKEMIEERQSKNIYVATDMIVAVGRKTG